MFERPRSSVVAATVLILWAASAVAGLAETVHALDHWHEADHAADDHWQRVSQRLTHGHEHALDTPDHTHAVVSATPATVPSPQRHGATKLALVDTEPDRDRSLLTQDWLTPPARPSPNTALHQALCVLLI